MKKFLGIVAALLLLNFLYAQNNVGIGTTSPHESASLHVHTGANQSNGILVTGTLAINPTVPELGQGARMMFYPGKAAFRAGYVNSTEWNDINVGLRSVAMGLSTQASGESSFAMGYKTKASGPTSVALGYETIASGYTSTAMGYYTSASGNISIAIGSLTTASGDYTSAMGLGTVAKAYGGTAIGLYNDVTDAPSPNNGISSDRIFQIGNGTSNTKTNAVTVLRNGNVGIGNNALAPFYRLDVDSRMRIRSGGTGSSSAGIWFNRNDNSDLLGFVGVDGNNHMGIFANPTGWSFTINGNNGNAWVKGTVTANGVTLTSDERLKKEIVPLGNTIQLLEKLHGYQYHWKDDTFDGSLQTGLLAQEVEKVMPELVKTDDKGLKSVNYSGLIPYLLEGVKEQQQQIENLKILVEQLMKK